MPAVGAFELGSPIWTNYINKQVTGYVGDGDKNANGTSAGTWYLLYADSQNTYLRRNLISCTILINDNTEVDEPGLSLNRLLAGKTSSNTTNYFHTQKDFASFKATRFLTKQENWIKYAKAGITNFAIGTPSLELEVASLKAKYPSSLTGLNVTLSVYSDYGASYSYNNSTEAYNIQCYHEYGTQKDVALCSPKFRKYGGVYHQDIAFYQYNGWLSANMDGNSGTYNCMPVVSIPTSYVKERNNALVVEIPNS